MLKNAENTLSYAFKMSFPEIMLTKEYFENIFNNLVGEYPQ